ncbi:MAG: hypothetical protein M4579_005022 [Chaenotheca gracillima]|nr:MAG: hypothetical protein M4579_005022 [Chaenotheca gracillima]
METAKNAVKAATGADSQFQEGHQVPIQGQVQPGLQSRMNPQPTDFKLPTEDSGYQTYKAAGKLQGKKALITGGDSGIGRATALLFAMEGAESMITYLPEEKEDADEVVKKAASYGGKVTTIVADLRERGTCREIVDAAVREMGTINILVNNHGYQMVQKTIKDLTEEQWLKTFDTNIHPFFFVSKYALEHMHSGDTIINNASVNCYVGRPDLLDYTSTKGAIVAFTRGLSNQICKQGIRVNAVCPGPVWTPLVPSTMDQDAQDTFSGTPMGRPGQPSEVATCMVFLASMDSSFISGQSLHPNGGVVVNG